MGAAGGSGCSLWPHGKRVCRVCGGIGAVVLTRSNVARDGSAAQDRFHIDFTPRRHWLLRQCLSPRWLGNTAFATDLWRVARQKGAEGTPGRPPLLSPTEEARRSGTMFWRVSVLNSPPQSTDGRRPCVTTPPSCLMRPSCLLPLLCRSPGSTQVQRVAVLQRAADGGAAWGVLPALSRHRPLPSWPGCCPPRPPPLPCASSCIPWSAAPLLWYCHAASPVDSILDKESYTLEELLDEDELIQECKSLNARLTAYLKQKDTVEKLVRAAAGSVQQAVASVSLCPVSSKEDGWKCMRAERLHTPCATNCPGPTRQPRPLCTTILPNALLLLLCLAVRPQLLACLPACLQVRYLVEPPPQNADPKRSFKYPFTACEIFCCEVEGIFNTLLENEDVLARLFSLLQVGAIWARLVASGTSMGKHRVREFVHECRPVGPCWVGEYPGTPRTGRATKPMCSAP